MTMKHLICVVVFFQPYDGYGINYAIDSSVYVCFNLSMNIQLSFLYYQQAELLFKFKIYYDILFI